jgi:hypothetical protein
MDKLTIRQAQAALAQMHEQARALRGCAPGHGWHECPWMTLARLRGVGHTVYVVQDPADDTIRVIDWWDEGPVAGCGADLGDPYPHTGWGDAVLAALRLLLADAEFAETISGQTALGIAARALAEADAAADMARRYTP